MNKRIITRAFQLVLCVLIVFTAEMPVQGLARMEASPLAETITRHTLEPEVALPASASSVVPNWASISQQEDVAGKIVSVVVAPNPVAAGEQVAFTVVARNTGTTTWDPTGVDAEVIMIDEHGTQQATGWGADAVPFEAVVPGAETSVVAYLQSPHDWQGMYQYMVKLWYQSTLLDSYTGQDARFETSPAEEAGEGDASQREENIAATSSDDLAHKVYLPLVLKAYTPPPDLVVTDITIEPASPVVGQMVTMSVTVENQGTGATTTWFFVDLYVDPASPPTDCTDLGTYFDYCLEPLEPGASCTVPFTHTFASDGCYPLYAQADTFDWHHGSPDYGMIQESNETNNIYGPITVCVTACAEGIANGGFEYDGDWELPITEYTAGYTTAAAHSGSRSMRVGIIEPADNRYSYSSAQQWVTIPTDATSATLSFWLYSVSGDPALLEFPEKPLAVTLQEATMSGDTQYVLVLDEYERWIDTLLWQRSDDRAWTFHQSDLMAYAGRTIKLHFGVYNDGWDGVTGMYVDDASLELCFPPPQQSDVHPQRGLPRDPPPALRNP